MGIELSRSSPLSAGITSSTVSSLEMKKAHSTFADERIRLQALQGSNHTLDWKLKESSGNCLITSVKRVTPRGGDVYEWLARLFHEGASL